MTMTTTTATTATRRRIFVAALLLGPALFGGPTSTSASAAALDRDELVVFAAASLRDVFEQLAKTFEAQNPGTRVRFNFAGSQELRLQVEQGAKADLFASADQKHMGSLVTQGLARAPVVFARNELAVVVPRGAPPAKNPLRTFADLPNAKRLVVGAPEVPVGAYTLEVLRRADAKLGNGWGKAVEARVVSRELNVRQVLAKVVLGEADAGVVYRTDALSARDKVDAVEIPPDFNVNTEYPVAVLKAAGRAEAAQSFVDYLLSPAAQKALAAAGFAPAVLPRGP